MQIKLPLAFALATEALLAPRTARATPSPTGVMEIATKDGNGNLTPDYVKVRPLFDGLRANYMKYDLTFADDDRYYPRIKVVKTETGVTISYPADTKDEAVPEAADGEDSEYVPTGETEKRLVPENNYLQVKLSFERKAQGDQEAIVMDSNVECVPGSKPPKQSEDQKEYDICKDPGAASALKGWHDQLLNDYKTSLDQILFGTKEDEGYLGVQYAALAVIPAKDFEAQRVKEEIAKTQRKLDELEKTKPLVKVPRWAWGTMGGLGFLIILESLVLFLKGKKQ